MITTSHFMKQKMVKIKMIIYQKAIKQKSRRCSKKTNSCLDGSVSSHHQEKALLRASDMS